MILSGTVTPSLEEMRAGLFPPGSPSALALGKLRVHDGRSGALEKGVVLEGGRLISGGEESQERG